jgi:hypothetical protein
MLQNQSLHTKSLPLLKMSLLYVYDCVYVCVVCVATNDRLIIVSKLLIIIIIYWPCLPIIISMLFNCKCQKLRQSSSALCMCGLSAVSSMKTGLNVYCRLHTQTLYSNQQIRNMGIIPIPYHSNNNNSSWEQLQYAIRSKQRYSHYAYCWMLSMKTPNSNRCPRLYCLYCQFLAICCHSLFWATCTTTVFTTELTHRNDVTLI